VVLVCIFCRVDHIFSSQRICRSLLLQFMFMLMRGLSLGWAEYTNFLSVIIFVSAFSSGKILWRIKKINLNNHFFPLAKTSSRVLFLLLLTSPILRRRRKRIRMKIREKMAMVFDNKRFVSLVGSSELLKGKS